MSDQERFANAALWPWQKALVDRLRAEHGDIFHAEVPHRADKSWLGARASRHHHTLHKDHHDLLDRVSVGWKGIILLEAPPRTINYTKQRAYNADVFKTSTYSKGFCTRERSTRPSNRRRFARRVTSIARMVNLIGTSLNLT
jgi:hypothetical protein